MAADQLAVLGECHITFDNSRAHARSRGIGFSGMFRELQSGAAMSDRKIRAVKRPVFARHQLILEFALIHAFDKIKRPCNELYTRIVLLLTMVAVTVGRV